MKFLFRWMFKSEIDTVRIHAYDDGWRAGVNQLRYEPDTALHGIVSHSDYWGEEE